MLHRHGVAVGATTRFCYDVSAMMYELGVKALRQGSRRSLGCFSFSLTVVQRALQRGTIQARIRGCIGVHSALWKQLCVSRWASSFFFLFLLHSSRRPKTLLLWALATCNIIPWSWEFTPGKPSSSSTQNPCMLTYRSSHKNHPRLVKYSFSVSLESSRHPVYLRTTTMEPVT